MRSSAGIICALGDAHLDVVVRVSWPLAADTDTPARTRMAPGGQAANVAAWVVALGGRSRLIAARATDLAASLVAAELRSRGVDLVGPVIDGQTGVIVSLSDGGDRRSMLTDPGGRPLPAPESGRPQWVAAGALVHLPAHSLPSQPLAGAALARP